MSAASAAPAPNSISTCTPPAASNISASPSAHILGKAFAAVDVPPRVVVLSACESVGAKKALLPSVSVMIVMKDSVSDVAATAFATRFYAAIAAGQSLKSAFKQGALAVEHASINFHSHISVMPTLGSLKFPITRNFP
jgi:CHAT domain